MSAHRGPEIGRSSIMTWSSTRELHRLQVDHNARQCRTLVCHQSPASLEGTGQRRTAVPKAAMSICASNLRNINLLVAMQVYAMVIPRVSGAAVDDFEVCAISPCVHVVIIAESLLTTRRRKLKWNRHFVPIFVRVFHLRTVCYYVLVCKIKQQ